MQKLINLLIMSLFLISCQANSQDSKDIEELNKKRNEFAEISKNSTGAIEAHWQSPSVLVLTVKQDSLKESVGSGIMGENGEIYVHEGFTIAVAQATLGRNMTGELMCVKVLYEDGQEVAATCAAKQE